MTRSKFNVFLIIACLFNLNINCNDSATFPSKDISLDSLVVLKNKLIENKLFPIDSSLYAYLSGDDLQLLLSCNLSNISKDTLVIYTDHNYRLLFADRMLQIKSDVVRHCNLRPLEIFNSKYDTILPGEAQKFYIPILGFPNIENVNQIYLDIQILGKYLESELKPNNNSVKVGIYVINKTALYLDLNNNKIEVVGDSFDKIYQKFKRSNYKFI